MPSRAGCFFLVCLGFMGHPAEAKGLFWDQYLTCRVLLEQKPDSALLRAEGFLRVDPNDFLGSWLKGASLFRMRGDSVAVTPDAGAPATAGPGSEVTKGTVLLLAGRIGEGGAAFDQAQMGFVQRGRLADAARALLWKSMLIGGARSAPETLAELDRAEDLARRAADPAAVADVLLFRAGIVQKQDPRAAADLRQETIPLLEPLGPSSQLIEGYRSLAIAEKMAGELDAAEGHYTAARELAELLQDRIMESRSIAGMAQIAKARGATQAALELQKEALQVAEQVESAEDVASRCAEIGTLYTQLGRYREAAGFLERALKMGEAGALDPGEMVFVMDGLAAVDALRGRLDPARRRWEQALEIGREKQLRRQMPFLFLHLAQLHLDLGDPERARPLAEEGLRVAREVGHRRAELPLLSLLSNSLLLMGQDMEALKVAREAAREARAREPRYLWEIWRTEAEVLHRLGRTREAIALLDSTVALMPEVPDSVRLGMAVQLKGNLQLQLGDEAAAESSLRQSLTIFNVLEVPNRIAGAQIDLGHVCLALRRPAEAVTLLQAGLRWAEGTQMSLAASAERTEYGSRWYDAHVDLAVAHHRLGEDETAFTVLEGTRARELRLLLQSRTPGLRARVGSALAEDLRRVEEDLTETQTSLLRELGIPAEARTLDPEPLERRADSLKTIWDDLSRKLEREAPQYSREIGILAPVSATAAQRSLRAGERLLAYMVGSERTLVFLLEPHRFEVRECAWAESSLTEAVASYVALLRDETLAADAEPGVPLSDSLLAWGQTVMEPSRTLYVLPDGVLHYLPFEALPVEGQGAHPEFLIEQSAVVYANSAGILLGRGDGGGRRPGEDGERAMVAFGDPSPAGENLPGENLRGGLPTPGPLPYAREEVERFAELFPKGRIYLGSEATEGNFMAAADGASLLHVAAHAFADDQHPLFSGIVLSPGPSSIHAGAAGDGLVQAFEVLEQSWDMDLAVLSACQSGRGKLLRGEGFIGLARALRLAGVRNLMVSLWSVEDRSTAEFMAEFYGRIRDGVPAVHALQQTKISFLRSKEAPAGSRASRSQGGRLEDGGQEGSPSTSSRSRADASDASGQTALRGVGKHVPGADRSRPATWAPFILIGSYGVTELCPR